MDQEERVHEFGPNLEFDLVYLPENRHHRFVGLGKDAYGYMLFCGQLCHPLSVFQLILFCSLSYLTKFQHSLTLSACFAVAAHA